METDNQLLEKYALRGSEQAFRELVERRIGLVHSAALRQSEDNAGLAEEITQTVFTELARQAAKLARHPALSGWLYTCVRQVAANARRAEQRRQRREQEAFTMKQILGSESAESSWQQVRPELDDVMHQLNEEDRTAVVLRFFEDRSLKEVGQVLGLTENAARMRVDRSLEKLRGLLSQRGIRSSAATLAAMLVTAAITTPPSTLASTISAGALAGSAVGSAVSLAKLVTGIKTRAALAGAGVIAAACLTWWLSSRPHPGNTTSAPLQQPEISSATPSDSSRPQDEPPVAVADTNTAPKMILHVIETETGAPLPETKVLLAYLRQDGRGKDVKLVTDYQGNLTLDALQSPFHYLNMFLTANGHVPKVTTFRLNTPLSEYTMSLERGISISGMVVDEAGQPIAGAKVQFDGPGNNMAQSVNIQFGPDTETLTDSAGRWSCNMVPEDLDQVRLIVTHPEHAETSSTIHPNTPEATSSVITMLPGFSIAGRVQDLNGNPIEGAKVREVRMNSEGERCQSTDSAGAFSFRSMKLGELILAVQAIGFSPAVRTLQVTGAVEELRFQLGPGQLLRGRVVDDEGNPITNAWAETLRTAYRKIKWETWVDQDGRFKWDSAPQEPLLYSFEAEGYQRGYALELQADGSEHEIKLHRNNPEKDNIQINATVLDAQSGQPLDGFKVLQGEANPDYVTLFQFATSGNDGKFTLSLPKLSSHRFSTSDPWPGTKEHPAVYQFQILKEGYQPLVTSNILSQAGSQTFEFRLQPGGGLTGTVVLAGGEAAENAMVLLCTSQGGVTMDAAAHIQTGINTTTYRAQTDSSGRFALPAAPLPQGVIVVHDQGFAELSMGDFSSGGTITLQPWGRIEGTVMLDSKPVADEHVVARRYEARYDVAGRRFGFLTVNLETKSDSEGKFVFEKVPTGECEVSRSVLRHGPGGQMISSHEASVKVVPGVVSQAVLGGSGKTVIGAVVLGSSAAGAIDWRTVPVHLTLKNGPELGPFPKRHDFQAKEDFIAAVDAWDKANRDRRHYGAFCEGDGSFRLPDIPAGSYELRIKAFESGSNSGHPSDVPGAMTEIGSIVREITVANVTEGASAEAIDLGTLELTPQQHSASTN